AVHFPADVQQLDIDFYAFSALPMTRQQININTLDVTQSVILEAARTARLRGGRRGAKNYRSAGSAFAVCASVDRECINKIIVIIRLNIGNLYL
ncbi:hypothetical protein O5254_26965, partial [Escherichia coli]|nr:hypothetical protein [Escherichia coli]